MSRFNLKQTFMKSSIRNVSPESCSITEESYFEAINQSYETNLLLTARVPLNRSIQPDGKFTSAMFNIFVNFIHLATPRVSYRSTELQFGARSDANDSTNRMKRRTSM